MSRVVFTRLADGTGTLLDLQTMSWFTLNRTGVRLWELLAADPAGAAGALAQEYALPLDEARAAVDAFVADLAEAGLAVPSPV
jgi:hypothetical protein